MPDLPILAISLTPRGMNSSLNPSLIDPGQVAKIVNGQLDRQTITTRPGSRVIPVEGEWDRKAAVQGAVFYDPKRGVGAQVFSDDSASIFLAAGGRKYRISVKDVTATSKDVTGDATQDDSVHLIWMTQAENYLIAGDGKGPTYIFDGENAFHSTGFIGIDDPDNGISRDDSSVPQGITVPVYAHGRLWVVVDSRRILAGDSLHGENQTASEDLIKFTEQGYWATGQFFVPPSSMGNVIAGAILPTRDTGTGQGEIMFHCQNGGIFSIKGNIYPRENWANSPMVNHFVLDTGAAGPYAIDIQEGDQLFRSRTGIQTLRSARAESNILGRPLKPISEEVGVWMNLDYVPYLRFVSLVNWSQQERLMCTVAPQVEGRHTYSRGLVVLNWDPTDSQQSTPAWEGLWTFPKCYRNISHVIRAQFRETERAFGVHFDGNQYSLVEYDPSLKCDILEDGTKKSIETVVESKEITGPNPYDKVGVVSGSLHLREISRTTAWRVDVRTDQSQCWTKWRAGEVCLEECPDPCNLTKQQPRNLEVELGKPPESLSRARRWQFRVTITGWARIEGLVPRLDKLSDDNTFAEERLNVSCKETPVCCDDVNADFSYSVDDDVICGDSIEPGITSAVTAAVPNPPPEPEGPPTPPEPSVPPEPPEPPGPGIPESVIDESEIVYDLEEDSILTDRGRGFDGADYLSVADALQSGLDLSGPTLFSFNFWAKSMSGPGLSGSETILSKGSAVGDQQGYRWGVTNTAPNVAQLEFAWSHDGSTINTAISSGIDVDNNLHMYSLVFNGSSLKMYIDGVEDYSGIEINPSVFNNTAPFEIGRSDGGSYQNGGDFGLLGIWSRALSPTEITNLYNAGTALSLDQSIAAISGIETDLISFWHLNEHGTIDAQDAQGAGHSVDYTDAAALFAGGALGMSVPNATVLTPDDEFTISFWFYGTGTGIQDLYTQWGTNKRILILWREDLGTIETYWINADNSFKGPISSAAVSANTLYNVTVTYSSSGNLVSMWVNDGTASTLTGPTGLYTPAPAVVRLGDRDFTSRFSGYMQHLAIWSRVLTSGEITALYNGGEPVEHARLESVSSGITANLNNFWHLNEGSGTRVDTVAGADMTDNANILFTNGSVEYPATVGAEVTRTAIEFNVLTDLAGTSIVHVFPTPYPVTDEGAITHWENRATGMSLKYAEALASGGVGPRMVGGKPTWDAIGFQRLRALATFPVAQPNTVVIIATPSSVAGDQFMVAGGFGGQQRLQIDSAGTSWAMNADNEISGGTPDATRHILIAYFDGASSYLELDGVQIASGDAGPQGFDDLYIGTDSNGNNPWLGSIETVILIARELTGDEKTSINAS